MRFKPTTNSRINWVDVCCFPTITFSRFSFHHKIHRRLHVCVCNMYTPCAQQKPEQQRQHQHHHYRWPCVSVYAMCEFGFGFLKSFVFFSFLRSLVCHSDYCRNIPHCAGVHKRDETACACLYDVHDRCVSVTCTVMPSCMACGEQYFNRHCWQHIDCTQSHFTVNKI